MSSVSLYKSRTVSTLYRRERNNFNPKFYKDHNSEVGNLRVCWVLEEPPADSKMPPKKPDK